MHADIYVYGETVLIYGVNIRAFITALTLSTMRKKTKGTLHTSGLISVRDRRRTLKLEEQFLWFYVRIAAKDPMRDI